MARDPSTWRIVRRTRELLDWLSIYHHRGGFVALRDGDRVDYLRLPRVIWSTKSHEWWTLLAALLRRLQPDSILELGSGRSTIYLSEYACKEGKALVSIDEDPRWVAVNRLIARLGSLDDGFLHHVPLSEDGYFEIESLERLIVEPPDFIYLDAPVADRSGLMKRPFLLDLCSNADVIVIDDIQWAHIYDQMEALQDAGKKRQRTVIEYKVRENPYRFLCVLTNRDLQPILDEIIACLGVRTVERYSRAQCVRE
jgi:predicted O-methyltransferase YrrM